MIFVYGYSLCLGQVFAPTNAAFEDLAELLNISIETLLALPPETLISIIRLHVVPGVAALSTDLVDGQELETLNPEGSELKVMLPEGGLPVIESTGIDATVVGGAADIVACGAVVHVIDKVLLPFGEEEPEEEPTVPGPSIVEVKLKTVSTVAAQPKSDFRNGTP